MKIQEGNNYLRIFNSSTVMGMAAAVNLILGLLRTKAAAIFMGVSGFGFLSAFISIQNLFIAISGVGLQTCGSRSIAIGLAASDSISAARSSLVVARISVISGFIGLALLILFSSLVNQMSFGNQRYLSEIILLGLSIFFSNIANGKIAILQGFGLVGDIALINSISALVGTCFAVLMYVCLGSDGIVLSLVSLALIQLITSEIFFKKLELHDVVMSWKETLLEARRILPLGMVSMISGLLGSLVTYFTIALLIRSGGSEEVAIYSAAFALSAMFVNFVLQAMSMDYFPHLSSVIHDNKSINTLVNQQTEIGLLLCLPGILATVIFAKWAVSFFYSPLFSSAEILIYWFIVGCLARVVSWPLGYVALAMGKSKLFLVLEVGFSILHLLFVLLGVHLFGTVGVATAFFLMYAIYVPTIYFIVNKLTGFHWSESVKKILISGFIVISVILSLVLFLNSIYGFALEIIILLCASIIFLKMLILKIGKDHVFFKILYKFIS